MAEIYIVMTHSGTIPSKLIRLYTRSQYSHVSISVEQDLKTLYSFGRKSLKNPLNGGFSIENIDEGIYKIFKNTSCKIFKMTIDDSKYDRFMETLNIFLKDKDLYRYNFLGLATMLMNVSYKRKHHYFCSQFVSEVLHECDIYQFKKDFTLIKPNDFNDLKNVEIIYEGKLHDYSRIIYSR